MPCPKCYSHNLWDDIMWWGCDDCGWMTNGTVRNNISLKDKFNQPKAEPIKTQEGQ